MINLNHIYFGYGSKKSILKDLSLSLAPGHIYGLLGRNGVGKTSLMHILGGLRFPDKGECLVNGFIPQKRTVAFLREVYYLSDESYFPPGPMSRYLDLYTPFYPQFDHKLFYRSLSEFGTPADAHPNKLSLGQRKQVTICFALATQAKVLLLDEPTNGLDIPAKKIFRKIVAGAMRDDHIMIISTHQVKDLESLIDHVLILDGSEIVVDASIDDITQKILFKKQPKANELYNVIYSEPSMKGDQMMAPNIFGEDSKFDMELFFNAVIAERGRVADLLNS